MDPGLRDRIRELLGQGLPTDQVARDLGIPRMSVAAVLANVTRGTYGTVESPDPLGDISRATEAIDGAVDLKFGLERDLQMALRANIHQLASDLLIADEGRERRVATGLIDILAEDSHGRLIVIELKAGAAPDDVVAQILAYMAALREEERGRDVRGIVIARSFSRRVEFAARSAPLGLVRYGYQFTFSEVQNPG